MAFAVRGSGCSARSEQQALIFRKDLEHEGALVRAGEKHILSLNLWAQRKKTRSAGQVLLVRFGQPAADDAGAAATAAMLVAANKAKTYAIDVDILGGLGKLSAVVDEVNSAAAATGKAPPPIVDYMCTNHTYVEFGTVFRVLTRQRVSEAAIFAHKDALDFFGLSSQ